MAAGEKVTGDAAVLRDFIRQALLNHPWPWRVEIDWGVTVQASDATRIFAPVHNRNRPDDARLKCEYVVELARQEQEEWDAVASENFADDVINGVISID